MTEAALTLVDGRAQVRKALEDMECSVAYTVRGRYPRSTQDGVLVTVGEYTNTSTDCPVVDKLSYQIEDMRMVAERAAAETVVAVAERNSLSVAQLRCAQPRKCPYGRKRDICRLKRFQLADFSRFNQILHTLHNGVIMQLQLNLAGYAAFINKLYHLIIFVHVKAGNFHRENVNTALCAQTHLSEMFAVFARKNDSLDFGMRIKHCFVAVIAGDTADAV